MALEVAKLRTEVDVLMATDKTKVIAKRTGQSVIIYKEE